MSESVQGVELSLDKETSLRFTERKAEAEWRVQIQSDKMMKGNIRATLNSDSECTGHLILSLRVHTFLISHLFAGVSFVGVEDNFSICDVTVLKLGENIVLESKPEECVITGDTEEREEKRSGLFRYKLKIKFHADIFGSFKQTVVFDFGERPFLSKVKCFKQKLIKIKFVQTLICSDADCGRSSDLLLV